MRLRSLKRLKHLTVKQKLLLGFGITIFIGIAQATLVMLYLQFSGQTASLVDRQTAVLKELRLIERNVLAMQSGYRGFLLTGQEEFLEPYLSGSESNPARFDALFALGPDRELESRLKALRARILSWEQSVIRPGIALRRSYPEGVSSWVTARVGEEAMEDVARMLALLRQVAAAGRPMHAGYEFLPWLVAIGGGISAVLSLLVGIYLARSISRRLSRLTAHARQVSSGDFTLERLTQPGHDEVGQLAGIIDKLLSTLSTLAAQASAVAGGRLSAEVLDQTLPGEIGRIYRTMIQKLRGTSEVLGALGNGELLVEHAPEGPHDELGRSAAGLIAYLRDKDEALRERHAERDGLVQTQLLEARVNRALDMAHSQDAVMEVMTGVFEAHELTAKIEVLMADNSNAHLQRAASVNCSGEDGCKVSSPAKCHAVRRGHMLTFESTSAFDACPYVRSAESGCSAVCIPLNVMGRATGIVHVKSKERLDPEGETVRLLQLLGSRAGERLSVVRAFERTRAQAETDALTGLLNRRSATDKVRDLIAEGRRYAVAYADLDHFKRLNDTHGHEVGDQALRLFARSMTDGLRPDDIVARWGGEEFVAVLPGTDLEQAALAMRRVQTALALALRGSALPRFTVSVGVHYASPDEPFPSVLATADAMLLEAKRAGRNCVLTAPQFEDSGDPEVPDVSAPADAGSAVDGSPDVAAA